MTDTPAHRAGGAVRSSVPNIRPWRTGRRGWRHRRRQSRCRATVPTITTRAIGLVATAIGLPYPIEVRPRAATAAARAEPRRQVEAELRDSVLLDHTGQVVPRLGRRLQLLARPEVSVDSAFLPALGRRWVTVTPSDAAALGDRIREMVCRGTS